MFLRSKKEFFYLAAAAVLFTAGWACNKYGNVSGIPDNTVVAVVGDHQITFGDWMRQTDLLRVFDTPIDADNKDQVKAVLDSLVDQQLVLEAAQKAHYSDGTFDENLKKKLQEADLTIKNLKDKLEKDIETLRRVEKDYQEPLKKMLLARQFAKSQVDGVEVTEKDMRDWYEDYSAQARQVGRNLPPYSKINERLKNETIKPQVEAEKFLKNLQGEIKVERKTDVIDKYLASLSISEKMLGTEEGGLPLGKSAETKDAGGK